MDLRAQSSKRRIGLERHVGTREAATLPRLDACAAAEQREDEQHEHDSGHEATAMELQRVAHSASSSNVNARNAC